MKLDMSNPVVVTEQNMRVDVISSSKNNTVYLGGDYIGCQISYQHAINVSAISKITYKLKTGTCYGGGAHPIRERFWYRVGVLSSIPSTYPSGETSSDMGYLAVNEYTDINTDYGEQELDVSSLTGTVYLVINCHGWNSEIEDIEFIMNDLSDYNVDSPYYCDDTSNFTVLSGRTYSKCNDGSAYCFAVGFSSFTEIMVVSKTVNYTYYTTSSGQPNYETGTFTFQGETWYYKRGWGFGNFYGTANRIIDVRYVFDTMPSTFEDVALYCTTIASNDAYALATPKMTSNTTPSGVVSCSSRFASNYEAWYAFNQTLSGDPLTWATTNALPQWIQYQFPNPVCIQRVIIINRAETNRRAIETFIFQGSNDGTSWTDLKTCTSTRYNNYDRSEFIIPNDEEYIYYRLYVTSNFGNLTGSGCGVNEIELYEVVNFNRNITALVPTMTSSTTPSGRCGADSELFDAYYAFNGSTFALNQSGTFWSPTNYEIGNYIYYEFTMPVIVKRFGFKSASTNDTTVTKTITLIGSDDGINWTNIRSYAFTQYYWNSGADFYKEFNVNNDTPYLYYGIRFNDANEDNDVGELQFYGIYNDGNNSVNGSTEAIRDWVNSSLYNKDEIFNLFIQNNQDNLVPYELTFESSEPDMMIRLRGLTSGKIYNICLEALMIGEDMKETVLWTNSGNTNPNTITLNDDWTKYKLISISCVVNISGSLWLETVLYPATFLKNVLQNNISSGLPIKVSFTDTANDELWYTLTDVNTFTYVSISGNTPVVNMILGYS